MDQGLAEPGTAAGEPPEAVRARPGPGWRRRASRLGRTAAAYLASIACRAWRATRAGAPSRLWAFALALSDLVFVLALAGLPALFFWRIFSGAPGDVATFARGDFTDLHYPYRRFVADELSRGVLPVWDPYVSAGHPALGDVQFASLYPIGAVFALLGGAGMPVLALEQQVVAHFALAGVFTYLLGRRLLRTRAGALVAALTFTYGGYLTSFPVQQVIILQTSVWLPLILLFLDVAICWRSPALAVPAGLALAMAALAGHPQTLFYVLLGAGLYFAYRCWERGPRPSHLLAGVVFLGLGLGLAAPQLIPAYQHLQLTDRGQVTYPFTTSGFAFRELFGALVPYRFGGQALYQGILPLALVGVALLHPTSKRAKGFWLLTAILALLLSFGGSTFLQSVLYLGLPPLKFRDHERLSFLVGLAVAMLAGYGADAALAQSLDRDALRRYLRGLLVALAGILGAAALFLYGAVTGYPEVRSSFDLLADRTFFTALLLALAIGLLAARLREPPLRGWPLLAVLLIAVDLFSTSWQLNLQSGAPDKLYPMTATLAYLRTQTFGLYRIASEGLLPGDGNAGSAYRLQDIVGNSPLEMESYQRFTKEVGEWQRWRLLNVRYLVTKRNLDNDGRFRLAVREGDVSTYEIKPEYRLPRAWIVHRSVFAGSDADALALLNSIEPADEAVLQDERVSLVASPPSTDPQAEPEQVDVLEYAPDRVVMSARLEAPGLLVASEVYHPDWVATVDGETVPILKADGVLRGVLLPAGRHRVEMTFVPTGFTLGLDLARQVARWVAYLVAFELAVRLVMAIVPPLLRLVRWGWRRWVHSSPPSPLPRGGPQARGR